jgi:uncharacterized protein YjbI with pentapeptide repeats
MSIKDIAWPGPRPLTPNDRLFGRASALDELASRCQTYDVVEITAASGVGKTSFIRAGGIETLEEAGFTVAGPAYWPDALQRPELAAVQDDTGRFANVLYRIAIGLTGANLVLDGRSPAELVQAAADGTRLVVILDQMDELLRYRRNVGNALLAIAGEAARQARVPHVVIARTEFREQLGPVEVPGATVWNLYLEEISSSRAVRRIISEPAAEPGVDVEFTDDALDQLVQWWQSARAASGAVVDGVSSVGGVGLLHLQALLAAFKRWAVANELGDATRIDGEMLERFATTSLLGNPDGDRGAALLDAALVGHVEAMIDRAASPSTADRPVGWKPLKWSNGPRVMLARIAPSLSASGYKVPQTFSQLMAAALSHELGSVSAHAVGSAFDEHLTRAERVKKYRDNSLGGEPEGIARTTTGIAGTKPWAGQEAIDEMAEALHVAVEFLRTEDANVLRKYTVTAEAVYELVHDRIGAALQDWADRFQNRPIATIDRIVARPGGEVLHALVPATFQEADDVGYWQSVTQDADGRYQLAGSCWNSYYIGPPGGGKGPQKRLMLEDLHLSDGDFASAAFKACDLTNVAFTDVSLRGAGFIDCAFTNVTFTETSLRGAVFINCSFENVTFHGGGEGSVEQSAFNACSAVSVTFAGFAEIRAVVAQDISGGSWEFRDSRVRHLVFSAASPTQVNFVRSPLSHASLEGQVSMQSDSTTAYVEVPSDAL